MGGRFLKGSLCAVSLSCVLLHSLQQCLKSISLLGLGEHCYVYYLEPCAIAVSSVGAKIKLFQNGILEATW